MTRPSRPRTSAVWLILLASPATIPLLTAACTNDFSALYKGSGSSSGSGSGSSSSGGTSSGECWDGSLAAPDAPEPPTATTFTAPCMLASGCRNATQQPSNFACNVCDAVCDNFQCAGTECEIWCSQGTTCHGASCNLRDRCDFYCDGCDGELVGSALSSSAHCTAGALCDIKLDTGNQDSFTFECSASRCKFLIQATDVKGSCTQDSTCDISCARQGCTLDISCDESSTCILRCDTKDPLACPAPDCGGKAALDCGVNGWKCNVTSC
jgi:hypothetical protein